MVADQVTGRPILALNPLTADAAAKISGFLRVSRWHPFASAEKG